jgi:hypothetical protein
MAQGTVTLFDLNRQTVANFTVQNIADVPTLITLNGRNYVYQISDILRGELHYAEVQSWTLTEQEVRSKEPIASRL